MARPLRLEFPGALYHLTARGNARQDIYLDDEDRARFLGLLGREAAQQRWRCYAYCLMGNHYHLLLETREANLAAGMRRLNGVYTQGFNRRHGRGGHLLQGRYKSILVDKEGYFLELSRYIVLNPVRAGLVRRAEDWPWSSYRATAGESAAPAWLDLGAVLARLAPVAAPAQAAYRRFVAEGLAAPSPWEDLRGQIWLGDEDFLARMQRRLERQNLREVSKAQSRPARPDREAVLQAVMRAYGVEHSQLLARREPGAYRAAAYLLRRATNLPLKEVARTFAVSPSRISRIQSDIERGTPDRPLSKLLARYKVKN